YHGAAVTIDEDMIVRGSMTSSDREGNFYRTLVIEDATGALELKTGLYDMHNTYPEGWRVTLKLRGLRMDMDAGVLQVGAVPPAWAAYKTDYLGHRVMVERYLINERVRQPVAAAVCAAGALQEEMCGRLMTVPGMALAGATPGALTLPDETVTWASPSADKRYPPATGYRKFKDAAGDSVIVATSGYATFAATAVPPGTLALTGILGRGAVSGSGGRSVWILRLRDTADIN
ncbi:MAG: DUF5689 domain-containing protein, partial [Rikenellaceae bacterium]|nr:DUF5689 domain-containing protein [Rikenellaceae bacterium]